MKWILTSIVIALALVFLLPLTVGAITGQDALQGLVEVLKAMVEAYKEYLAALM